jgi:hypothetical protein
MAIHAVFGLRGFLPKSTNCRASSGMCPPAGLPVSTNHDELDNLALLLNQMLDKIGSLIENIQLWADLFAHRTHFASRLNEIKIYC